MLVLACRKRNENGKCANEQEQHDEEHEQKRPVAHRMDVDIAPRNDEEERDEEAERKPIELSLETLASLRNDVAQDEACRERAEHDIEIEHRRERGERDHEQHGRTHHGLLRGLRPFLNCR